MIEPLWDGRSKIEVIARLIGSDSNAYEHVRETAREIASTDDFESHWQVALHDGILKDSQSAPVTHEARGCVGHAVAFQGRGHGRLRGYLHSRRIGLRRSLRQLRLASGAPRPHVAAHLGQRGPDRPRNGRTSWTEKRSGHLGHRRRADDRSPRVRHAGQADGTIGIALGYGRTAAGHVGGSKQSNVSPVGANAYAIRQSNTPCWAAATVQVTQKTASLATTQDHHAIDMIALKGKAERLGQLVRETTKTELAEHPDVIAHALHLPGNVSESELKSLWKPHTYDGHRWGMSIDMNKCIGCNACVIACQAENNIPVVGKERVLEGREMHWLRIDRYFQGEPENPTANHQPVGLPAM